jgi:hypothetical protein
MLACRLARKFAELVGTGEHCLFVRGEQGGKRVWRDKDRKQHQQQNDHKLCYMEGIPKRGTVHAGGCWSGLMIQSVVMPDPSGRMFARRIMVGPVNKAALFIPDVFSFKVDFVTFLQRIDTWSKVNIVDHKKSAAIVNPDYKSLMSAASRIITQCPDNNA